MLKDYFEVPNKPAIKSGNILSCDFTDHETFIPQPLDFTRNTLATYVDCNGLIKMDGVSDTELVTNGDFATDSDWVIPAGWSIDNGKAIANFSGGTTGRLSQTGFSFIQNKTYKVVFTISDYQQGNIRIEFRQGGGNTVSANYSGNGTYTLYQVAAQNHTQLSIRALADAVLKVDSISIREVDSEIPRIDYLTEIGKAKELQKPSLLLEPQSTNLITFSDNFSQWTVDGEASISSDSIISPEGIQNSDKLIAGTTSGRQAIKFSISKTGNLAFSIFAKKGEYSVIQLSDARDGSAFANFNLDTGVVGNSNVYTASIVDMSNGWYRCKITWNAVFGLLAVRVGIVTTPTSARVENFAGNGSDGLYIYGAQLEEQGYPTSYIPTSGSTVTRNVELCSNAGQRGVFNNEKGTIYVEFTELGFDNPNQSSIVVSQSNSSNNRLLLFRGGGSNWSFQLRAASVNVISNSINLTTTETLNKFAKVAVRYKSGEITAFVNGSQSFTNSSTFTLNGKLDKFGFIPYDGSIGNNFYGRVKCVKVFRRTLTDSEMAELTNNIT